MFRVSLCVTALETEAPPAGLPEPGKPTHSELQGKTILLVEDSLDNQYVLRNMMEMAGASVCCASNGVEGVSMALEKDPDVVLMDLQIPLLDGYKTTAQLRRNHFTKPILALTAHALHEERDRVLKSRDFDGFLTKPIGFKQLIETLKKWVDKENTTDRSHARQLH